MNYQILQENLQDFTNKNAKKSHVRNGKTGKLWIYLII